MNGHDVVTALAAKRLVFTVTSGRSGTGLLAALLRDSLGINADHEPAPRVNFVLRSIVADPELAPAWLVTEKLPAMLARATGPVYAETSHLICKGLIEALLDLGLRPAFLILSRDAGQVARSLYQLNVIPERTGSGRTVLLGPSDPGVLPLPEWQRFTDYQLCFWYCRETERRQAYYRALLRRRGCATHNVDISGLTAWKTFRRIAAFVSGDPDVAPDLAKFRAVVGRNQNSRSNAGGGRADRPLPPDLTAQEQELDAVLAQRPPRSRRERPVGRRKRDEPRGTGSSGSPPR